MQALSVKRLYNGCPLLYFMIGFLDAVTITKFLLKLMVYLSVLFFWTRCLKANHYMTNPIVFEVNVKWEQYYSNSELLSTACALCHGSSQQNSLLLTRKPTIPVHDIIENPDFIESLYRAVT
ncbi:hypothetical protein ACJX0J_005847, partial [Zea mays]